MSREDLDGYGSVFKLICGVCGAIMEGRTTGPSERGRLLESWNETHAECRAKALELSDPRVVMMAPPEKEEGLHTYQLLDFETQ